jgi:hypothetical protein
MNEKMWVEQFTADLDGLLAGEITSEPGTVPEDYQDVLEVARILQSVDFSDARKQHQLRQKLLNHPVFSNSRQNKRLATAKGGSTMDNLLRHRNPVLAGTGIAIMLLLALTLAPVRAFAQELLHQIGAITLTSDSTPAERFLSESDVPPLAAQPTAVPGGSGPGWQGHAYESAYVPAGYELHAASPGLSYVNTTSVPGEYNYFRVYRLASTLEEFPISRATVSTVEVRQTTGSFVEGAPLYIKAPQGRATRDELEPDPVNLLMWEENGQIIVVESNHLPLDELLRIADSVELE